MSPGTSELFVVDNDGSDLRGVCGAISWQILNEKGQPIVQRDDRNLGRRLVVTYYVSWQ